MTKLDFSERLSELMILNDLTIMSLAKGSGCSKTAISAWLNYNIYPTIKNIIKLADFFGCSIDYLVGLSDDYTIKSYKRDFCFVERLDLLVKQNQLSYYKLAKSLGIDERYFTRWKKGTTPSTEVFISLAKYFNTTIDYLIGRED